MGRGFTTEEERTYAIVSEALHRNFEPHEGQKQIGAALFTQEAKRVFVRCGRKFGKTSFSTYCLYRKALLEPGSRCYYLTPLKTQADEIVWSSGVVPNFILDPEQFEDPTLHPLIKHVDKQKMRITFWNGSFIRVDGSDNVAAQRGWNPDFVVADEFADFDPRWAGVMIPNLLARKGTILFMGTPPEFPILSDGSDHQYVAFDKEFRKHSGTRKTFHFYSPTSANPHMDPDWLAEEKARLYERGDGVEWEREYMANIVTGARQSVFPMYNPDLHLVDHTTLASLIAIKPDRYDFYCTADPGTKAAFAVIFIAIDRYTSSLYVLDELYETDPGETSARKMVPRIIEKTKEYNQNLSDWNFIADSAASWYIQESYEYFDIVFSETEKQSNDKQDGISLIKDLFMEKTHFISKRCEHLSAELLNYRKDDKGRYIKLNDHLIDAFRYTLKASCFSLNPEEPPKTEQELNPGKRFYTLEDDLKALRAEDDWTYKMTETLH